MKITEKKMAGGHGEHGPYVIPSYKIYNVGNAPLLVHTQRELEKLGLCNPWLRNQVWRYDPKYFGTELSRTAEFFLRGYKFGIPAAIISTAISLFLFGDHGHDHDHKKKH